MRRRVAIVYNEPRPSRYDGTGEEKAVLGVLDAVEAVHRALLQLDFDAVRVPLAPPLARAKRKLSSLNTDLVFNLFEGFCGHPKTEALIPEILSQAGITVTGCPGSMLRLALDKAKMKMVLHAAGIPTPDFQLLNPRILHLFRLDYPCIVKPRGEDASLGISGESVVNDFTALERQVSLVSSCYSGGALVEEFLEGREFNATVLGDSTHSVLPISEIAYSLPSGMPRILTFAAKWETDSLYFQDTSVVCPADLEVEQRKRIAEIARAAFALVGGRGYARVDMRMGEDGELNVIEVNPNPDISPGTGAARQAEAAGMSYNQFIEEIVLLALDEKNNENQYSPDDLRRQTRHSENAAQYPGIQTL
jgi:D-alanine-D-alanine ligase